MWSCVCPICNVTIFKLIEESALKFKAFSPVTETIEREWVIEM